jgi:hypothetical protein
MVVSDLGLFTLARHPQEMGCGLWWFGKLWPWLLLAAATGLRGTTPAEFSSRALLTVVGAAPLNASANTTAASLTSVPSTRNATLNADIGVGNQSPLADPVVLSVIAGGPLRDMAAVVCRIFLPRESRLPAELLEVRVGRGVYQASEVGRAGRRVRKGAAAGEQAPSIAATDCPRGAYLDRGELGQVDECD